MKKREVVRTKKRKYDYNFTEDEDEEEEEEYKANSNFMNIPKPEIEDSTFIQFLLNKIMKNNK